MYLVISQRGFKSLIYETIKNYNIIYVHRFWT